MNRKEKIKNYEDLPLTLRDFYAGQAMTALMINSETAFDDLVSEGDYNEIAWSAFMWADAMLARRDIKKFDEWEEWGDG